MRAFALTMVAVGIATALLMWGCFRLIRDAEKMERDPTLLRRRMLRMGLFYICLVLCSASPGSLRETCLP